ATCHSRLGVDSEKYEQIPTSARHSYTHRHVDSAPTHTSRRIQVAKEHGQESEELLADSEVAAQPEILVAENLTMEFTIRGGLPGTGSTFKAVDDVSFTLPRGATTALVGESGSGKSTVANIILNLLEPTEG